MSNDIAALLSGRLNESVEALEELMLQHEQIDIPADEKIVNGMYIRRITIPAGTILTGRVWLEDYVDIMISGKIVVATVDGVKELSGYNVCDGYGGRKRAGYALEDTEWLTVHKTDATECKGLLEQLSTFSMAEYKIAKAQLDYKAKFSSIAGIIEQQSQETKDFKSVPVAYEQCIEVKQSPIAGLGLFSKQMFKPGDHIAPARVKGFRTEAGKYSNHSCFPNAAMKFIGDSVALVAIDNILPGDEILTNYESTLLSMKEALCQE